MNCRRAENALSPVSVRTDFAATEVCWRRSLARLSQAFFFACSDAELWSIADSRTMLPAVVEEAGTVVLNASTAALTNATNDGCMPFRFGGVPGLPVA